MITALAAAAVRTGPRNLFISTTSARADGPSESVAEARPRLARLHPSGGGRRGGRGLGALYRLAVAPLGRPAAPPHHRPVLGQPPPPGPRRGGLPRPPGGNAEPNGGGRRGVAFFLAGRG